MGFRKSAHDDCCAANMVRVAGNNKTRQASFDIPKAFPIDELGECHGVILIPTGEGFDLVVALLASQATPKRVHRKIPHDLRKISYPECIWEMLLPLKRGRSIVQSIIRFQNPNTHKSLLPPYFQQNHKDISTNVGTVVVWNILLRNAGVLGLFVANVGMSMLIFYPAAALGSAVAVIIRCR